MNTYEFGLVTQIGANLYVRAHSFSEARRIAETWLDNEDETDDCYLDEDRYYDSAWQIASADLLMEE